MTSAAILMVVRGPGITPDEANLPASVHEPTLFGGAPTWNRPKFDHKDRYRQHLSIRDDATAAA
jgi:hypothetical protein